MPETLSVYSALSPPIVGLLLFPLGLVAGSFSSVLLRRLPMGRSLLGSRSECPSCLHALMVTDLVPVLSVVWLRGRCRYCRSPIPQRYLLLEIGSGAVTALAGYLGGWGVGFGVLLAGVAGALIIGGARRGRLFRNDSGFTLVEVLVALLLLTLALGSTFEVINVSRKSALAAQRRSLAVGLARERFAQAFVDAMEGNTAGGEWLSGDYRVMTTFTPKGLNNWWVTVSVTCPGCKGGGPTSGAEVTLSGVVSP